MISATGLFSNAPGRLDAANSIEKKHYLRCSKMDTF